MIVHFSGALYNIAEHPCLYLHSVIRRRYLLRRTIILTEFSWTEWLFETDIAYLAIL